MLVRCPLSSMAPTSTSDLPELPAEIWVIIWQLVAAQSGFVGAWRLIGGAICKAATEGWGSWVFDGFLPPPITLLGLPTLLALTRF